MRTPILKAVTLLAFTTLSALAMAADPPARVGRVAFVQGQVGIDAGGEQGDAQLNWPVTSGSLISTRAGARTEVRIGSISIRLDGDSSLEVLQLDDSSLRLRLAYGSASIRVPGQDGLAGFELETPQARVRLQQPGRVRIDTELAPDTSAVTVFDGAALVDAGGAQLTVRAGKRAEVGEDDVRTLSASRDGFDDWAAARDRSQDSSAAARYVGTDMTGYEDLDRYGNWSDNADYGPLWYPSVAAGWVPYRDGSWTWLDPWGWTWVDNAPWGYAPFHYGRWVQVRNRWAWAPGRRSEHHVWAPALVGWVGGAGWNATFRDRSRHPAAGWYPLTPHDRYVPAWQASSNHLGWLNQHVRPDPRRPHDYRPPGLTVVPQGSFGRPGRVDVPRAPIATVPPTLVHNVPAGSPPARPDRPNVPNRADRPDRGDWDRDPQRGGGRARFDTDRADRDGVNRPRPGQVAQLGGQVSGQITPTVRPTPGLVPPATPVAPQPIVSPTPHQSPQPLTGTTPSLQQGVPEQLQNRPGWRRDRERDDNNNFREERRERQEEWRRNRQAPTPVPTPMPAPAAVPNMPPVAAAQQAQPPAVPRFERPDRQERGERPERQHRAMPSMPAPMMAAPAQASAPAPRPAMPAPPPVAAASAPAPAPAAPRAQERSGDRGGERGKRQER
jgi:hypothetical protein